MLRAFTRFVPAASLAAALGLTGCAGAGGAAAPSGPTPFQAAVSAYYRGLNTHDASVVCSAITPAFWEGMAGELRTTLGSSGGGHLPGRTCLEGLRYVFRWLGAPTSSRRPRVAVRDVSVHGNVASATLTNGATNAPARFIRSATGHWQLDCCTGAQLNHLPSANYRVPSTSMEPTLRPGEIVTANNQALRTRGPALGEIVTLHPPARAACENPRQGDGFRQPCGTPARRSTADVVIKRVVGLPGDRISIDRGHVVRNGSVERERYILACGGALCDFPHPVTLPPGTYYVLGDNRGNSLDSRFYGPVPRSWIVGVVAP